MNMFEMVSIKQDGHKKKLVVLASLVSFLMLFVVSASLYRTQPAKSHISIVSRASASFPCQNTLYPDVCQSLVLSTNDGITPTTTGDMFDLSLKFTVNQVHSIRSLVYNVSSMNQKSNTDSALDDCIELLDHSLHQLSKIQNNDKATWSSDDIQTWLSAAITHQTTCLDTLQSHNTFKKNDVFYSSLENNIKHISNSLALHKSTVLTKESETLKGSGGRKLLSNDFPTWVSHGERRLLKASVNELKPHAVVSVDGTGTHKTIGEAIASVSLAAGSGRTVIHVTAGTYSESSLNIPLTKSNVMLVGDGKGVTVITGSKSAGGGSSTFSSATFGASGDGFIARDITFVNTAGPAKHQAVALRVTSDKSVFYRCSIIGYQDTLYTLSNRQFYRETDIYGTIDFIFGNSAVVFQSCNIVARNGGKNYITAQGRSDPNQNTGISFHKCKVSGQSNTYLGRPWKQYSRTVYMQSSLDGSINPAGWFPWSGSSYLNTLYYGEYMNTGSGASTSGRVKWGGVHTSMSSAEASKFTVGSLISGGSWLPSTGIIYEN
ncbi:pectinesterase [Ranunculus cassubicifolius]